MAEPKRKTEKRKEDLDKKLDEQLEETFPSSDPPSLSQPTPNKPAGDPKGAEKRGEGVDSSRASDLRDTRQGAYDQVGNQTIPDDSRPTEHERQQSGGAMQGEPIPTEKFELPEGLKRQPIGPYSRDRGRSDELPDHVPKHSPNK
jgi:hypothetical protein